MKCKFNRKK